VGEARGEERGSSGAISVSNERRVAEARPGEEKGDCAVNFGEVEKRPNGCRWTDPVRGGVPGIVGPDPDTTPAGIGSDREESGLEADTDGAPLLGTFLLLCNKALASGSEVTAMQKRCFLSAFNPRQKT